MSSHRAVQQQSTHEEQQVALSHGELRSTLAAFADASEDAVVGETLQGIITIWSPAAERLYGYSAGEAVGKPLSLIVPSGALSDRAAILERVGRGETIRHHETVRVCKGGGRVAVSINVSPVVDSAGRVVGAVSIERSIGRGRAVEETMARFRAFEAERERMLASNLRYTLLLEAIFESTQAQLALLDREMNFVLVNSAYAAGSGHSKEELIGRNHFALFPHAENQVIFERVRDKGEPYEAIEKPFEYADQPERGTTFWNWVLVPIRDEAGRVQELLLSLVDVTQQVGSRSQMKRLKEDAECRAAELDAAIASIPDAVLIYSPTGSIERMNAAARAMLGYSPAQTRLSLEKRVALLRAATSDGKPFPVKETPSRRALRGETVFGVVMLIHTPDGRPVWTSCSAAPILAGAEQMLGAVVILRDITEAMRVDAERERLLAAERESRAEAEAAVRARDEFISIAAHELKTPITSLRGYAELLVRQFERTGSVEPARLAKSMEQMMRQSERLARLMEQLLNVTQLDDGRLVLVPAETDLSDLLESAIDSVGLIYPGRAIVFRGKRVPRVRVDGIRLEQVVRNLLDNALKYSPKGSPVEVDLAMDGPEAVRISIRDCGEGVPEAERGRIFDRLYQGHGERYTGGLGLGLFVSRQIVEMHGGRIGYESAEDGGGRFVMWLPISCAGVQERSI